MKTKSLYPHPNSKEWTYRFKLRAYKGQILDPEDMSTWQLSTYLKWASDYLHWSEVHRIKEPTMENQIKEIESYRLEYAIRLHAKKRKRR